MNKKTYLLLVVVAGIVVSLIFAVRGVLQEVHDASTRSTTCALGQSLIDNGKEFKFLPVTPIGKWYILTDAEYDRLIDVLMTKKSFNPDSPSWEIGYIFKDHWNNRFKIAFRRLAKGNLEFLAWSAGADGITGTKDDIVAANEDNVSKYLKD